MLCWTHQPGRLPRDCFTLPKTTTQGPKAWLSEGMQVHPLQSPPQLLAPSQVLREEEEQQLKSTNCDCPGTPAPRIRHAAVRTRLAICHARVESETDLGGSRWPPDQAERQTAELLPATALPHCLQQSQHGWSGQGLPHPLLPTWEPGGWRMPRGCSKEEDAELQKNPLRQQQSEAWLSAEAVAGQMVAAAESPPACLAAPESQNGDGLFQTHDSRCCSIDGQCFQ